MPPQERHLLHHVAHNLLAALCEGKLRQESLTTVTTQQSPPTGLAMSQSLCCCSPCRPTFKRHVDGIYPANPEDGLVKNKMETLVYYAVTSPEKLDRIGEYLETRVGRDIYRNRKKNVVIGMEAMDQVGKT